MSQRILQRYHWFRDELPSTAITAREAWAIASRSIRIDDMNDARRRLVLARLEERRENATRHHSGQGADRDGNDIATHPVRDDDRGT